MRSVEGDEIPLEDIRFSVIETAGHTPESICYLATDTARGETPVALFSGDTLFVGDVGRPDLFPGRAEELASSLYDNLHTKIMTLPDECEVYPAHGMGSLCGRAMAAKRTSTIGYEKKYNYALRIRDRGDFVRALTSDMPAAPDHFARCSAINRAGPALMRDLVPPVPIEPKPFFDRMRDGNSLLLDVRSYQAFSGVHIPGAWHIDLSGNFPTQAGWILPHDRDILLVVEERRHAEEAALQLRRVGFDRVAGFLDGGMLYWGSAGLPISRVPVLCPEEVHTLVESKRAVLIDVRSKEEWEDGHADRIGPYPMARPQDPPYRAGPCPALCPDVQGGAAGEHRGKYPEDAWLPKCLEPGRRVCGIQTGRLCALTPGSNPQQYTQTPAGSVG